MLAVKFLERKGVLQFFGAGLILAPFANALMYILLQKSQNQLLYKQLNFWKVLTSGTPLHYLLAICSLIIGFIMIQGSQKAWTFVLGLLGIHILLQLFHLGENIRQNWLWGVFFIINAGIFIFIADQLVFKLKIPEAKNIATKVSKNKKLKKVEIGFKDFGIWAELVTINSKYIQLKKIKLPPADIETRLVEFSFKKAIKLKAKYSSHDDNYYYFNFFNLSEIEFIELNSWINKNAS